MHWQRVLTHQGTVSLHTTNRLTTSLTQVTSGTCSVPTSHTTLVPAQTLNTKPDNHHPFTFTTNTSLNNIDNTFPHHDHQHPIRQPTAVSTSPLRSSPSKRERTDDWTEPSTGPGSTSSSTGPVGGSHSHWYLLEPSRTGLNQFLTRLVVHKIEYNKYITIYTNITIYILKNGAHPNEKSWKRSV